MPRKIKDSDSEFMGVDVAQYGPISIKYRLSSFSVRFQSNPVFEYWKKQNL